VAARRAARPGPMLLAKQGHAPARPTRLARRGADWPCYEPPGFATQKLQVPRLDICQARKMLDV
jgi:hypothetical protein